MKKEDITSLYVKVGRIRKGVADEAGIKCADVYITRFYIKHIEQRHGAELSSLGVTPIDFVKMILVNYNRIYAGSDDSIILVVYNNKTNLHSAAALKLNYIVKKGIWEIKTAQPRSTRDLERRKRIWQQR